MNKAVQDLRTSAAKFERLGQTVTALLFRKEAKLLEEQQEETERANEISKQKLEAAWLAKS